MNNENVIITDKLPIVKAEFGTVMVNITYEIDDNRKGKRDGQYGAKVLKFPGEEYILNKLYADELVEVTNVIKKDSRKELLILVFVEYEDYNLDGRD
jgi:hypothetical protein